MCVRWKRYVVAICPDEDISLLLCNRLAPRLAQHQTHLDLHPALQTCPIRSRAKWHLLLLFVLAAFLLSASPCLSGASQSDSSQSEFTASNGSSPAEGFSGNGTGDPFSVDQDTPDSFEAAKIVRGESNSNAALFTHPTCNLLSELTTATERSTRLLYSFKAIGSSSTARGPPSSIY